MEPYSKEAYEISNQEIGLPRLPHPFVIRPRASVALLLVVIHFLGYWALMWMSGGGESGALLVLVLPCTLRSKPCAKGQPPRKATEVAAPSTAHSSLLESAYILPGSISPVFHL